MESVDEQLRAMDGAEELLPKDMASKAPRWLDLGVLGPGQFIGDIPIILGVNSPFQIEAITGAATLCARTPRKVSRSPLPALDCRSWRRSPSNSLRGILPL